MLLKVQSSNGTLKRLINTILNSHRGQLESHFLQKEEEIFTSESEVVEESSIQFQDETSRLRSMGETFCSPASNVPLFDFHQLVGGNTGHRIACCFFMEKKEF